MRKQNQVCPTSPVSRFSRVITQDWGSGLLTVTPAAPVYNGTELLGVVGIDMDFTVIDRSIVSLRVVDEEGYAYLLAPTGVVAAHPDLDPADDQSILDLEPGVDEDEFGTLLAGMIEECSGTGSYQKDGESWLISWKHETASGSGASGVSDDNASEGCQGFIVVVTVSEATLLGVRKMDGSFTDRTTCPGACVDVTASCLWPDKCWSHRQFWTSELSSIASKLQGFHHAYGL